MHSGSVGLDLCLALALGRDPVPMVHSKTLEANGLARLGLACGNYWGVWKLKEWRNQVPL